MGLCSRSEDEGDCSGCSGTLVTAEAAQSWVQVQVEGKRDPRSDSKGDNGRNWKDQDSGSLGLGAGREEVGGTGDCGFTTATLSPTKGFLLTLLGLPLSL